MYIDLADAKTKHFYRIYFIKLKNNQGDWDVMNCYNQNKIFFYCDHFKDTQSIDNNKNENNNKKSHSVEVR